MSKTLHDITHPCRCKTYPDGHQELLAADRAIFREPGYEDAFDCREAYKAAQRPKDKDSKGEATDLDRSRRRAKAKIYDIAMSNNWDFFVTFTLNPDKIERFDAEKCMKSLKNWLDNRVRRHGLKYILVPERHKDGGIHFHGFVAGGDLRPVDSGHKDKLGHTVYNLDGWGYGFSTAIRLYGDRRAACGYVCKYISKSDCKVGGRWYYSGGDLCLPVVSYCELTVRDLVGMDGGESYCFEIPEAGLQICKWVQSHKNEIEKKPL